MQRYALEKTYQEYLDQQAQRAKSKFWSHYRARMNQIEREFRSAIEIEPELEKIKNVICMGIRGGNEYKVLKAEFPKWDLYGVDICPMVERVGKNCFAYDFSKLPKEWENKFDLVYSNSLDHAYDLEKTIEEWKRVGKKYFLLNLSQEKTGQVDIYSFSQEDIPVIFKDFIVLGIWKDTKGVILDNFNVLLKKKNE